MVVMRQFWYHSKHWSVWSLTAEPEKYLKKKKIIAVFFIPLNHNSDPQEVSAATSLHHQQHPHHTGDFQFHYPAPPRWLFSLQTAIYSPTPIDARPSPSTCKLDPNPCQFCTARSPASRVPLQDQTSTQIWLKLTAVLTRTSLGSTQPI